MGVRLVRESSETPNITNRDDCKMIRYAYGNYVGVVKKAGNELNVDVSGSTCTVKSGRLVVDGWEVDVDDIGIDFSISGTGKVYHSIEVVIVLLSEQILIRRLQSASGYPETTKGDDLTQYPNGVRRVITHHLISEDGVFTFAKRVVPLIPYLSDIEERIEKWKFTKSSIKMYYVNSLDNIEHECSILLDRGPYTLIRSGKIASLRTDLIPGVSFTRPNVSDLYPDGYKPEKVILDLPMEFAPKGGVCSFNFARGLLDYSRGILYGTPERVYISLPFKSFNTERYEINNVGWELE